MRNLLTLRQRLSQLFPGKTQSRPSSWLAVLLLTLSLTTLGNRVLAETAETAPPQVKNLLGQIDAAANKGDVRTVMQFYSQNFTHSDGLTLQTMEKALTELWKRYPRLQYRTQLQSWKPDGRGFVAETVTNITGSQSTDNNKMVLNATIKSRQLIENQKIVRQEILTERTQLTSGSKPPTVDLKVPEQVKTGQQYTFDAIVQEPLGDDYLLGAAIEEPVKADKYLNPTSVELELLPAGGLFKQGQAPAKAESRWVSAVLVRGDGMTMITTRMNVK